MFISKDIARNDMKCKLRLSKPKRNIYKYFLSLKRKTTDKQTKQNIEIAVPVRKYDQKQTRAHCKIRNEHISRIICKA